MNRPDDLVLPAHDAFGRTAPLAFNATWPFTGVRLQARSNAQAAIDLAARIFAPWSSLDASLVRPTDGAHLDIIVHGGPVEALPSQFDYRRHGSVFMAAGAGLLATVHLDEGRAVVFVSPSALAQPDWFCAHAASLGILAATQRDRVPLHAATVVRRGLALLLVGTSGVGKSTLTYACGSSGYGVLAEDTTYVGLDGGPRLWGHAGQAWLSPDVVRFFPWLAGRPTVRRANGKHRIAAPLDAVPPLVHHGDVAIVLLTRGREHAALERATAPAVAQALADVDEGFDQYDHARPAVVEWLTTLPAFHLDLGTSPSTAVALLDDLHAHQR